MARPDDYDPEAPSGDEVRPRVSTLTYVLIVLNVLAGAGFAFLLVMDYQKRQDYSYKAFLHDLAAQGLPLEVESAGPSASQATLPRQQLSPEELKTAYQTRLGKAFELQGVEEVLRHRITKEHLSDAILRDHLETDPVYTLEDEVKRVRDKLAQDMDAAAAELVAAAKGLDAAKKRALVAGLLLPLTYSVFQVEQLDTEVRQASPEALDGLLHEAAQRHMLADVLGPLERYRPSNIEKWRKGDDKNKGGDTNWVVERIADVQAFKLDHLKDLLRRRFDAALADRFDGELFPAEFAQKERDSIERRSYAAFLLFTAAQARRPDGKLLNPQAAERAQRTCGLLEYAAAARYYVQALERLTERLVNAIYVDREGAAFTHPKTGKEQVTPGFVQKHAAEIRKLQDLAGMIKDRRTRLTELQGQAKAHAKLFAEREQQAEAAAKRLAAARQETKQVLEELRAMQRDYFRAQRELAEAVEESVRLERRLRQAGALREGRDTP